MLMNYYSASTSRSRKPNVLIRVERTSYATIIEMVILIEARGPINMIRLLMMVLYRQRNYDA